MYNNRDGVMVWMIIIVLSMGPYKDICTVHPRVRALCLLVMVLGFMFSICRKRGEIGVQGECVCVCL